ncbi:MAG: emopamil-binding family protein [Bacteroidetes bacterium]|nr:emopamil-binding family protein [Bacteroidota bacterium]
MRITTPLKQRPVDYIYLAFFIVNILFITYIVDLEQLVIKDPAHFNYPFWPRPFFIDMIHWWGNTFDPLQAARPVWWKATIWLDVIIFGPYYLFATYAFIKGKEWIRIPTFIYASILFTNVFIICSEEIWGPIHAINLPMVLLANAPWFLFPVFLIWKMWKNEFPFTRAT